MDAAWFSPDGLRLYARTHAGAIFETVDFENWTSVPIAPTEKSNGQVAVSITSPSNGKTVSGTVPVVGSVNTTQLVSWKVEIGEGASPTDWKPVGNGTKNVDNNLLGGVLRNCDTLGNDQRHGLPDMHYALGRKRRAERHDQLSAVAPDERWMQ